MHAGVRLDAMLSSPSSLPGTQTIHYSAAGRLLAAPQPILPFMLVLCEYMSTLQGEMSMLMNNFVFY